MRSLAESLRRLTKIAAKLKIPYLGEVIRRSFSSKNMLFVTQDFNREHKFNCYLDDHISSHIFWYGLYTKELPTLRKLIPAGATILDIGANIGEFTVFMATSIVDARIVSFEPVDSVRAKLQANIALNNLQNVQILPFGLSDREQSVPIFGKSEKYKDGTFNEGMSSLFKTSERNDLIQEIRLAQLDALTRTDLNLNRIDFVKIDIEGSELFALRGAKETITKHRPYVWFENNFETMRNAGYSIEDLVEFFNEIEYEIFQIDGLNFVKSPRLPTARDLLATPKEKTPNLIRYGKS